MIALDADEALSANWRNSPEWNKLLRAAPGTVLAFQWVNLLPGCLRGWLSDEPIPFGFVDDGTLHQGESIHSQRLPTPEGAPWMVFEDIKVLHYQYTDWARMKSKQRWYQCWERINNPEKRAVTIFRQYHHMDAAKHRAVEIDPAWLEECEGDGSTMPEADSASHYRWDDDVLALLSARGVGPFRKLNIWDVDWANGSILGSSTSSMGLEDPRSWFDKLIHKWLQRTQPNAHRMDVRIVQKLIQLIGW